MSLDITGVGVGGGCGVLIGRSRKDCQEGPWAVGYWQPSVHLFIHTQARERGLIFDTTFSFLVEFTLTSWQCRHLRRKTNISDKAVFTVIIFLSIQSLFSFLWQDLCTRCFSETLLFPFLCLVRLYWPVRLKLSHHQFRLPWTSWQTKIFPPHGIMCFSCVVLCRVVILRFPLGFYKAIFVSSTILWALWRKGLCLFFFRSLFSLSLSYCCTPSASTVCGMWHILKKYLSKGINLYVSVLDLGAEEWES